MKPKKFLKKFASPFWKVRSTRKQFPINFAAKSEISQQKSKKKPKSRIDSVIFFARIYLVKFTHKSDTSIQFLKVGMSTMSPDARFIADVSNYYFEVVALSASFSIKDALIMEKSIHRALLAEKHRPICPLKSGNTECYSFNESSMKIFSELVNNL